MLLLHGYLQDGGLPRSLLRVAVDIAQDTDRGDVPDVAGRYMVLDDGLGFVPHFPFERGLAFRASFDPGLLAHPFLTEMLVLGFSLREERRPPPPEVEHVYPTSDELPANLLRLYVRFSNPMQRGKAEAQIKLRGPDGTLASDALYRAPVELWDRNMRTLTVLLDPGRLKRGVGPNRELGPPLRAGQVFTLAVGCGMTDISGSPLPEAFNKRFRVMEEVRDAVAVEQWKLGVPAAATLKPLTVLFPAPLDWAMLPHTITVASADGQTVTGQVAIDDSERRWSFTPALPWVACAYDVRVASSLEDVCGNSVLAPFDRPIRPGSGLTSESTTRSLPFVIC